MGSNTSQIDRQPWIHLQTPRPTRITLLGLPDAGQELLLYNIAPWGDAPPHTVTTFPMPGEMVNTLERGLLTITQVDIGFSMGKGAENRLKDRLRANADGFVCVFSASKDRYVYSEADEELERFVLSIPEIRGAPMLFLITYTDEEGALTFEDVKAGINDVLRKHDFGAENSIFLRANPSTGEGFYEGLGWVISRLNTAVTSLPNKKSDDG